MKLKDYIDDFGRYMIAKFISREFKHKGDSLTFDNSKFDYTHEQIKYHLLCEIVERYPDLRDRFPEIQNKDITVDNPEEEDVDIANLVFADWIKFKKEKGELE